MTSTDKMAQLSWGNRITWVTYKARTPANPILIPNLTRRSRNSSSSGQCHFRLNGTVLVLIAVFTRFQGVPGGQPFTYDVFDPLKLSEFGPPGPWFAESS